MASDATPETEAYAGEVLRAWGPPGTGKTMYLAARVRKTVAEHGPDSLLLASFSTTAAHEIASRFAEDNAAARPLRHMVGTLHSHAYRALGQSNVALDPRILSDWNASVEPELHITPDTRKSGGGSGIDSGSLSVDPEMARTGDELLGVLDRLRAGMVDPEDWPPNVRAFAARWGAWKNDVEAVDYCMDERTEVFTARGWLFGNDVREGDLVRSVSPTTGLAEWQPVVSVYRRRGRSPMIHMVNKVHDSLTTPDHRWLINRRNSHEEWSLDWATTEHLNSTARILRAAMPGDAPADAKYADAFVELVAWWFTEGSYQSGGGNRGQISQSHRVNPGYCARIEAALRVLCGAPGLRRDGRVIWSMSQSERRGMTFYGIGAEVLNQLDMLAPGKVPSIDFLAGLTLAQLRLFVSTALDADGHVRRQASVFAQNDERRTEAFAVAAILAGFSVTFAAPRPMGTGMSYSVTVSSRRLHAVVPGTTGGFATGMRTPVDYNGLIWCPTVDRHHNFLARRNGKVYYTGNTDMIYDALEMARDGVPPPGRPKYIVVDEAQDMTPLEIALALKWGELAGKLVLGMDDDQAINRWRGGDPAPLLALHGDGVVDHVLDRSYRVPESVRAVAERWVRRLTSRREKVYHSRLDEAGNMVVGKAHHVRETVRSIELINKIVADVDAGHTVMVIASCNYMLAPLIENMRAVGLPFHNPYRPTEQRWNPLGSAVREGAIATSERVRRFLALAERNWTGADVAAWAELVKLSDAGMVRGAKTIIARFDHDKEVPFEEIAALFRDDDFGREALRLATEPNVAFLENALLKAKIELAAYPLQIARHHGAAALDIKPKTVVGTIHSVKGAAADIVYVCPDVSPAAANRMAHRDGQAEAIRLFYVAMTRAYRELRVLAPATRLYPKDLVPSDLEVIEG
jgi:hypothetical protein